MSTPGSFPPGASGNPATQFKKGVSGNPAGRPKGIEKRLREKYGSDIDAIMDCLKEIAQGRIPKDSKIERVSAAEAVRAAEVFMDRLIGKPKQETKVETDLNIGPPIRMSKLPREQLEALAALDGGAPDGVTEH